LPGWLSDVAHRPPAREDALLTGSVPGRAVAAVLAAVVLGATLAACGGASPTRVQIKIHYSHYDPDAITVPHGVPVTFVLVNTDPIDHEWIAGDAALHQRHRTGTDPVHIAHPTEISIPAMTTRETTVTFDSPGVLQYICHVPGHEEYGMVGTLTIT
jgi:uncharacterized cupredoxin-like copper-binding protein